jgi:hypothetical protein
MLLICQGLNGGMLLAIFDFLQHKLLFLLADFGEGPLEKLALGRQTGFREVRQCPAGDVIQCHFAGRTDGLRPGSGAVLVATT